MTTNEGSNGGNRPAAPPVSPEKPPQSWRRRLVVIALASGIAIAVALTAATSLRQQVKAGSESSPEPGITRVHDTVESVPWSIHAVKVDRSRKDLTFYTPLARGTVLGISRISEMARDVPASIGKAVAAVNG